MASERVAQILRSKSDLSEEQIAAMTDYEGWAWIYAHKEKKPPRASAVCFTGFRADERARLEAIAASIGLRVVKTVQSDLSFLCCGENAGPAKLKKARDQGVAIFDRAQFEAMADTGEIPEN